MRRSSGNPSGIAAVQFMEVLGPEKQDQRNSEHNWPCPFCEQRGAASPGTLHVSLERDAAICHRCGYGMRDLRILWFQITGKQFKADRDRAELQNGLEPAMRRALKLDVPMDEGGINEYTWDGELPSGFKPITFPSRGTGQVYAGYLTVKRRLTEDVVTRAGIGFCSVGDFQGRIILPVFWKKRLVYFTSRTILDARVKAIHCDWPLGGVLYNMDAARRAESIVVCEGPFDALSVPEELGVGVSSLRNGISNDQMRSLAKFQADRVIFMFDTDSVPSCVYHAWQFSKRTDAEVFVIDNRSCDTCHRLTGHQCEGVKERFCPRFIPDPKRKDANDLLGRGLRDPIPVTLDYALRELNGTSFEKKLIR